MPRGSTDGSRSSNSYASASSSSHSNQSGSATNNSRPSKYQHHSTGLSLKKVVAKPEVMMMQEGPRYPAHNTSWSANYLDADCHRWGREFFSAMSEQHQGIVHEPTMFAFDQSAQFRRSLVSRITGCQVPQAPNPNPLCFTVEPTVPHDPYQADWLPYTVRRYYIVREKLKTFCDDAIETRDELLMDAMRTATKWSNASRTTQQKTASLGEEGTKFDTGPLLASSGIVQSQSSQRNGIGSIQPRDYATNETIPDGHSSRGHYDDKRRMKQPFQDYSQQAHPPNLPFEYADIPRELTPLLHSGVVKIVPKYFNMQIFGNSPLAKIETDSIPPRFRNQQHINTSMQSDHYHPSQYY